MTLQKIAQQAMDYLDSVGVAADWVVEDKKELFGVFVLRVSIGNQPSLDLSSSSEDSTKLAFINAIKSSYPYSKEQQEIIRRIDKVKSPN